MARFVVADKKVLTEVIIPLIEKTPVYGLQSITFFFNKNIIKYSLKIKNNKTFKLKNPKEIYISNVKNIWKDQTI